MAASIREGGGKETVQKAGYKTLPGGSYRSMWWVFHNTHGALASRGVQGRTIYVGQTAGMVLVRFASYPQAENGGSSPPPSKWSVPAEELEEINENIFGPIEVIGEYGECDA